MRKNFLRVLFYAACLFFLLPQTHALAQNEGACSAVSDTLPELTANCSAFYDVCNASNSDPQQCSTKSSLYVLLRHTYDVCIGSIPADSRVNCDNFDEVAVRAELRELFGYLEPNSAVIDVGAPPRTPTEQGGVRTNQPSTGTGNTSDSGTVNQGTFGGGTGTGVGAVRRQATSGGVLNYTPLEPLPGLENVQSGRLNFANLLESFFTILISIGGLLAVLMLIIGGITYMVSDVVHKKTAALKRIQAAIWGILLLVASWLILNTINPQLLTFSALIRPAPPPSASGLNTVTSGTTGGLTVADNDPNRDTKLQSWCPGGQAQPIGAQDDEFGTRFSNYTCTPADN